TATATFVASASPSVIAEDIDSSENDWKPARPCAKRESSVVAYRVQTSAPSQSVAPAAAATDTLSSSRIGIVSTHSAASAATGGTSSARSTGTAAPAAGRHHHASPEPASVPAIAKASVPATVLSGLHGQRLPPIARPASVAIPSPAARMPQAAAAISGR